MSRLRIKIELNPGGDGVRLDKLANISGELEKFLRSLAVDCGVTANLGEWVAREFYNGSMGAIVEHVGTVDPAATMKFNAGIKRFATFDADRDVFNGEYSETTIRQFVQIGERLDPDELVKIGLGNDVADGGHVDWYPIAKRKTMEVEEATLRPIFYFGSVQGKLGTWFKESDFIYVRDAVYGVLVRCNYRSNMYGTIHKFYSDKNAVVHVSGRIKSDRLSGVPKEISVDSIEGFDRLSDSDFAGLFGGAPNFIGDESAAEYLDRIRNDGES